MNKYRGLHETVVKELIDLIDLFKNTDAEEILDSTKRSKFASTSIAKIASNMTLVFPVLCSDNLTIDTAMMISKAIERKAVVMLQILFSACQISDAKDVEDFIGRFHSNIKLGDKFTVDDFIRVADTFGESVSLDKGKLKLLSEEFRQNAYFVLENNISDNSLSDMYKVNNKKIYSVRESDDKTNFRDVKDINDALSKQLLSSDIKKANELVPTTMVVNFTYMSPEGKTVPVKDAIIGVKARLIPVKSEDIISHVMTKLEDKNFIIQLIRATTREISFVKDFLLAIDKAKIEALANSKRGSAHPMWKLLERRAMQSRLKRFVGVKGNNANAITTLVISQEEVEYVKKQYNMNFESIKMMNSVLDAYNLMGLVIVDETLEVAKFHFDTGEDMWETLSFTSLEKEANDNSYKKIVNLMSKISR